MKRVRIPDKLIPDAKKIAKRGLYEIMWRKKPRNYGKRLREGKI